MGTAPTRARHRSPLATTPGICPVADQNRYAADRSTPNGFFYWTRPCPRPFAVSYLGNSRTGPEQGRNVRTGPRTGHRRPVQARAGRWVVPGCLGYRNENVRGLGGGHPKKTRVAGGVPRDTRAQRSGLSSVPLALFGERTTALRRGVLVSPREKQTGEREPEQGRENPRRGVCRGWG